MTDGNTFPMIRPWGIERCNEPYPLFDEGNFWRVDKPAPRLHLREEREWKEDRFMYEIVNEFVNKKHD